MGFNKNTYARLLATRRLGGELVVLDEVDSTNNWIAQRLADPGIDAVVAAAERQTAGRGRHGREWVSPEGANLAFSLAWPVPDGLEAVSVVTLAAGVALAEAVMDATDALPGLKYPNDLMIDGKKAAGILTELKRAGNRSFAVIGVGVNVNTRAEQFPEALRPHATSLLISTGKETSREALLASFLNMLERLLDGMTAANTGDIVMRFERLSAPFLGRNVTILGAGEPVSGAVLGLAENGGLMIETAPGVVKTVVSGEITFDD